ncbi:hypothetical protein BGZ65_002827 [Modicella reniformis]|uniref:Uncharacterized protein n=1 Tax=Modicella reniformis TaxID=1440133 RepID=A0A9P6LSU8_9FUNG|nr:hypothetical protein BGZ65_002827 [Modicella reniformis]
MPSAGLFSTTPASAAAPAPSATPAKSLVFDDTLVEHMRPGHMYKFLNILEKRCHVLRSRLGMPPLSASTLDHEQQLLNLLQPQPQQQQQQAQQTLSNTTRTEDGFQTMPLSATKDATSNEIWSSAATASFQQHSNDLISSFLHLYEPNNAFMGRDMDMDMDDSESKTENAQSEDAVEDDTNGTLFFSSSFPSSSVSSLLTSGSNMMTNEATDQGKFWQSTPNSITICASE